MRRCANNAYYGAWISVFSSFKGLWKFPWICISTLLKIPLEYNSRLLHSSLLTIIPAYSMMPYWQPGSVINAIKFYAINLHGGSASAAQEWGAWRWRWRWRWRDGVRELWCWMKGGVGWGAVVAIRVSSLRLYPPIGGLPRVIAFSTFLRLCLISLLSVAGCDDWGGFQSSGTAQVISQ